jgi:sulfatase maturation enzyme AslB (radical SAM superfamily)
VHATWIGGEPLLRKDLVERGMKLFPFNMIITNGTVSLPDWENCCFNVSVDGTKEYHAKVRGNNYDLIKRNIARSKSKVNLICVLSRLNADCIEDMVEEWSQTRVRGIVFDFYTPGKQDSNQICLTPSERDEVLERIKKLKLKYDNFIIPSFDLLNLMESQNARKVTSHCRMQRDVISLDASGNRILPCVMGKDADCSRCGCMIPFTRFDTPLSKKPQRYMDLLKMYSQYL